MPQTPLHTAESKPTQWCDHSEANNGSNNAQQTNKQQLAISATLATSVWTNNQNKNSHSDLDSDLDAKANTNVKWNENGDKAPIQFPFSLLGQVMNVLNGVCQI